MTRDAIWEIIETGRCNGLSSNRITDLILASEDGTFQSIRDERNFQDRKWGIQNHDDKTWLAILMEEVGELAMTLLDNKEKGHPDFLRNKELIQVAAVAVAWMECLARKGDGAKVWEEIAKEDKKS